MLLRRAYRVCQVNGDTDILQHLLLDGVGALELQHSVGGEDMLDGHDGVLCLLLSQLYWLTAPKEAPIAGKLRHLTPNTHPSCLAPRRSMAALTTSVADHKQASIIPG